MLTFKMSSTALFRPFFRLSELAGAKLSVGNPNLVDISDENRPTKLAERYNELYDNEWTDAFSVLTDSGDDDVQVINKLRNIFMVYMYYSCLRTRHIYY